MSRPSARIEHLFRRAGFGLSPAERDSYEGLDYFEAVSQLLDYDPQATDIDAKLGTPGYVGITTGGQFVPNQSINQTRQRWLFRMVHSPAPLQEKMAMFWHHHFATAYSKIAGTVEASSAARMMDAKPSEDPAGARGQIQLFRDMAFGKFSDLLLAVAKDNAMLIWLDGRTNTKTKPQENFGRELMELFTFGVENYVETDVYAAARVFTGWNQANVGTAGTASAYFAFNYVSAQHDVGEKVFSFPIYQDGSKRILARSATSGMQDGIDLINALAHHPATAQRLARRLWTWFVSETEAPDQAFVDRVADVYQHTDTDMKATVRAVLVSPQFMSAGSFYQRYSWPVEFVVRALKEVGYVGFSVGDALTPLINMGQQLYEPPDVNGWELGSGWFSTGGMLARMNFAAQLATNQKFALRDAARASKGSPQTLVTFAVDRLSLPSLDAQVVNTLTDYVRAGGAWVGSDAQLLNKSGGLFHLLTGAGEYQFV
jgi:uncharacterized protein (DUF1800 family)